MSDEKIKKPALAHGIYLKSTLDPFIDETKVEWDLHKKYYWYEDERGISYKINYISDKERGVREIINFKAVVGIKNE